jgi:formate C-acetyltransferase
MADILEKMSLEPAETFREALQTVWLLHVMSNIVGGSAMSFSRFDQYMLTFYQHDIQNGAERDELKKLLSCFWIKINEPKLRTVQSMTVGGRRPDGSDACTDLTRLCLETARDMKLPYPNIAVRVSKTSPEWLYDVITDTIKAGCGQPMILNDDVFIENFKKLGYPDSIANDYFNMGCVELMIKGKQALWGPGGSVVYTKCLEQTLDAYTKAEFEAGTFEGFMDYFLERIRQSIKKCHADVQTRKKTMDNWYDPFCSILTQDCVARGKDMHHGGCVCPTHWSIYAHGLGTLVDSLAAIKKFVYDDKKITMDRLIEAMNSNFVNHEELRVMLDRDTPNFGNDIDETDEIANRVFYELTKAIFDLNNPGEEDRYVATFFSYFSHVLSGEVTKATPNGRLAGQTLSDSMAPTQGKDVNGPTKMLNSVLKIDPSYVTGGYALNIEINPSLLKTDQGLKAFKGVLKAYLLSMGPQIQVNYIDSEALRDAQVNPEKHRNLVVRVGGYCEYFVNLDRTLQNEIIDRTVHDAV